MREAEAEGAGQLFCDGSSRDSVEGCFGRKLSRQHILAAIDSLL